MNLGFEEIFVIVILLLVLYGKRLPEITRAIGRGFAEIKRSLDEMKHNIIRDATHELNNKKSVDFSGQPGTPNNQPTPEKESDKNNTDKEDKSDDFQSPYDKGHNLAG